MERVNLSLGYLGQIRILGVSPFDDFQWNLKTDETAIHVLWAPSGCGKTTLCDAIEYSLFRNLHYKSPTALREKIKESRHERTKKGFIQAHWRFSNGFIELKQEFKGDKTHTTINEKPTYAEEYEKHLSGLGILLKPLHILYNGLTFVREIRTHPIFLQGERKRFIKALSEIISDPEIYNKISRFQMELNALIRSESSKNDEKRKLLLALETVHPEEDLKNMLRQQQSQIEKLRVTIINEEENLESLNEELKKCIDRP